MINLQLEEVANLIKKYRHIVLTAHINPDGDAVGSLLALMHCLTDLHKKVTCLIDDDLPSNFKLMPGWEKISRPHHVIDDADLLIILDSSDLERIGRVKDIVQAPILNIDHHISNNGFADYLYLDEKSAATGEIIYQLIPFMKTKLTKAMAICLYTAIATDCGFFRYANTTEKTMNIGAELIRCGVQPNHISEELEKRPLSSLKILAKVLDSLEIFANGKIACITVTPEILAQCDSTEGFIDFARIVEGVDMAIMVKYADESACRISMRSKNTDVSTIAVGFGGGGHIRAAGCTLKYPLEKAKTIILNAAIAAMGESKNV